MGGLYDQGLSLKDGIEQKAQDSVWYVTVGNASLQQEPEIAVADYQQSLEQDDPSPRNLTTDTVRYWSDYNRVFYHPRSIVQLNAFDLNSSIVPFEKYETGEELFRNVDRDEDILDRDFRTWAEECDQMQGIQIITGNDDAWAGFASRYIESLRDEFGKTGIWIWGIGQENGPISKAKQALRAINSARMIAETSSTVSMYVPLLPPQKKPPSYVHLDTRSQWHTSALVSAALESVSLPSRLRDGGQRRGYLDDLSAVLNTNGNQRIAQLQCSIVGGDIRNEKPKSGATLDDRIRSDRDDALINEDEQEDDLADFDINFSDDARGRMHATKSVSSRTFGLIICSRGAIESHFRPLDEDELALARKRRRFEGKPVIERYYTQLPYPLPDSFPHIFTNASEGNVNVTASLTTSSQSSRAIDSLQETSRMVADLEERETLFNSLGEMAEAYKEGWDSGPDVDSDD
ncbi:uncharacterized protein KY384_006509 [Bacidia gigantensis]|uniref:uncharacterized protein n=1 Tax=Bacidia gigantensis TaxID=2732470 RepID=UPI001D03B1B6|nr:uncharacterized protein KY384_006509 [Bacidia gigantensis]KAG8528820.1 hypothetical protein KY384_006509 [Bacidia gigantensis]